MCAQGGFSKDINHDGMLLSPQLAHQTPRMTRIGRTSVSTLVPLCDNGTSNGGFETSVTIVGTGIIGVRDPKPKSSYPTLRYYISHKPGHRAPTLHDAKLLASGAGRFPVCGLMTPCGLCEYTVLLRQILLSDGCVRRRLLKIGQVSCRDLYCELLFRV